MTGRLERSKRSSCLVRYVREMLFYLPLLEFIGADGQALISEREKSIIRSFIANDIEVIVDASGDVRECIFIGN